MSWSEPEQSVFPVYLRSQAIRTSRELAMSQSMLVRLITRSPDGALRIREYPSAAPLLESHTQIGIDDSSLVDSLRGLPVFRDLVGPIPEGADVARYETPEIFEALTKEWSKSCHRRRQRRRRLATWPAKISITIGGKRRHGGLPAR
jgi:hypothetical protein